MIIIIDLRVDPKFLHNPKTKCLLYKTTTNNTKNMNLLNILYINYLS